jgi:hypothetical protein
MQAYPRGEPRAKDRRHETFTVAAVLGEIPLQNGGNAMSKKAAERGGLPLSRSWLI